MILANSFDLQQYAQSRNELHQYEGVARFSSDGPRSENVPHSSFFAVVVNSNFTMNVALEDHVQAEDEVCWYEGCVGMQTMSLS